MRCPSSELWLVCALGVAGCFTDKGSTSADVTTTGGGTSGELSVSATQVEPGTSTTGESPTSTTNITSITSTSGVETSTTGTSTSTSTSTSTTGDGASTSVCQELCQEDADCNVDGMAIGFTCIDQQCRGGSGSCVTNFDCQALYSGWNTACAAQADCPGQACIDIGAGVGRCATIPSQFVACETLLLQEIKMPAIAGDETLVVCANVDYACDDGVCRDPCEDDAGCGATPGHPQCVVQSGACVCTSDAQCQAANIVGYAACRDGVCGCASDVDCAGLANADTCLADGRCGCSSVAVCTQQSFDGTALVCEGLGGALL